MGSSDKFSGGSKLLAERSSDPPKVLFFRAESSRRHVCLCDEANPGGNRQKWTQDVAAGSSEASKEEPSPGGIVERGARSDATQ